MYLLVTDKQTEIFRYKQTYRLSIINRLSAPSWSSSSSSISTLSLCGSFSSQPKQSCRIGVREWQGGWLSRIHPTDRPTHYRPQIPDLSNAPLQTVQNPSLHYILNNYLQYMLYNVQLLNPEQR